MLNAQVLSQQQHIDVLEREVQSLRDLSALLEEPRDDQEIASSALGAGEVERILQQL